MYPSQSCRRSVHTTEGGADTKTFLRHGKVGAFQDPSEARRNAVRWVTHFQKERLPREARESFRAAEDRAEASPADVKAEFRFAHSRIAELAELFSSDSQAAAEGASSSGPTTHFVRLKASRSSCFRKNARGYEMQKLRSIWVEGSARESATMRPRRGQRLETLHSAQ